MSAPPAGTARTSRASLDKALMKGLAWTGAVKWVAQGLSWLSTLVVAHLLSPDDYGVAGATMLFVTLVQVLNEFGLGAAVVSRRDLTARQLARLSTFSLMLGVVFFGVANLAAPAVAAFYHKTDVVRVIRLLSLSFVVSGLVVVPRALLTKELRYRDLAAIEATESIVAIVVTLTLATLGFGYWSLAWGVLSGRMTSALITIAVKRPQFGAPGGFAEIRAPLSVGWHVVLGSLGWYIYRTADANLITNVLGTEAFGFYAMALAMATLPLDRLNELVNRVTPGVFSSVQSDRAELERYVRRGSQALSLLLFPVAVGLALVAGDMVPVVLGERWRPAIVPLQLLSLSAVVRALVPLLNQVLVSTGNSRRSMWATVAAALVMPVAFWFGTRSGTPGVAVMWVVLYPLVIIPLMMLPALRAAGVGPRAYLHALRPAAEAALVMAVVVLLSRATWLEGFTPSLRLWVEVLLGMATYPAYLLMAHRSQLTDYLGWFRSLRARAP